MSTVYADRIYTEGGGKSSPSGLGPSAAGMLAYADGVNWNPMGDGIARWVMWTGTAYVPTMLPFATRFIASGNRAIGTTYQNTTGRIMFVAITLTTPASTINQALTDSSATPTTVVARADNATAGVVGGIFFSFMVLPSHYYKVTQSVGGGSITVWVEWS